MSNVHARIMNIAVPRDVSGQVIGWSPAYLEGHRDARHAAAEIANEAGATIADLLDRLQAAEADAERYRYLRNRVPADVIQNIGEYTGCWIDCEVGETLTLLTGDDADKAIDAARSKA